MADATEWHGPYSLVFLQDPFTFMQPHDCSITRYCLSASVYDYKASNINDTYGANGNMCHAQKVNADLRILPTLNDAEYMYFLSKHVIDTAENTSVHGSFQLYRQNTCKVENVLIFVFSLYYQDLT